MYLNNTTALSGVGNVRHKVGDEKSCKQYAYDTFQNCRGMAGNDPDALMSCSDDYAVNLKRCRDAYGGSIVNNSGNEVMDRMKSQGLDLSKLTIDSPTVDTLKPTVSPAVVNPVMSVVPTYSTQGLPISSYMGNASYGTTLNPIRLGNISDTVVDTTPEFLKGNNKYYTIAGATVILAGIYYATTTKSNRKKRK